MEFAGGVKVVEAKLALACEVPLTGLKVPLAAVQVPVVAPPPTLAPVKVIAAGLALWQTASPAALPGVTVAAVLTVSTIGLLVAVVGLGQIPVPAVIIQSTDWPLVGEAIVKVVPVPLCCETVPILKL